MTDASSSEADDLVATIRDSFDRLRQIDGRRAKRTAAAEDTRISAWLLARESPVPEP